MIDENEEEYEASNTTTHNFSMTQHELSRNGYGMPQDTTMMLIYLLSFSGSWKFIPSVIQAQVQIGKKKYQRQMKQLEEAGFIKRKRKQLPNGHFTKSVFLINEKPIYKVKPSLEQDKPQPPKGDAVDRDVLEGSLKNNNSKNIKKEGNNTHTAENSNDDLDMNLLQKRNEYCQRLPETKQILFFEWIVYLSDDPVKELTLKSNFKHFQKYSAQELTEQVETATAGGFKLLKEKPTAKAKDYSKTVKSIPPQETPSTERQTAFQIKAAESVALGKKLDQEYKNNQNSLF